MPRFMLDTDTCSYIVRGRNERITRRVDQVPPRDITISVITKSELLFGVELSRLHGRDQAATSAFLETVAVLDFPDAAATHYADIRAALKRRGEMIGANDLFLAAHARCLGLTLVTNNTREFSRVPGLNVENWAAA